MENLSDTLKREAIDLSLCRRWQKEWKDNLSQQQLIDRYKKGIDFCIDNDWPSNDFIKKNFDESLLKQNFIFVDEHLDIKNAPSGVYILNGACSGTIRCAEWSAITIYVRHEAYVNIHADSFSKVFVRLYDKGEADCFCSEDAFCKVLDRR